MSRRNRGPDRVTLFGEGRDDAALERWVARNGGQTIHQGGPAAGNAPGPPQREYGDNHVSNVDPSIRDTFFGMIDRSNWGSDPPAPGQTKTLHFGNHNNQPVQLTITNLATTTAPGLPNLQFKALVDGELMCKWKYGEQMTANPQQRGGICPPPGYGPPGPYGGGPPPPYGGRGYPGYGGRGHPGYGGYGMGGGGYGNGHGSHGHRHGGHGGYGGFPSYPPGTEFVHSCAPQ